MAQTRFAMIGGARRALQFLRVAKQLPDLFEVCSVFVRNPERREQLAQEWGVPTCGTMDELLVSKPKFVVVCVCWEAAPILTKELFDRSIPVLSETPPAPNMEELVQLYQQTDGGSMVQVCEQYHRRPMHMARVLTAQSGLLGNITEAQVSAGHAYHGVSTMRKLLGIDFEPAKITARSFVSPVTTTDTASNETKAEESQTLAWLDFGGKLGVFDFAFSQYSTPVRACRVLVRGDRGEIDNSTVRYIDRATGPVKAELTRHEAVDGSENCRRSFIASEVHRSAHETMALKGITLGDTWIYNNPFFPVELSDDQIAVATFLQKMAEYVDGGPSFYSLAESAQDHYLGMMIGHAAGISETVVAEPQVWAR